jgi:hypothetical protein
MKDSNESLAYPICLFLFCCGCDCETDRVTDSRTDTIHGGMRGRACIRERTQS